jgi:hypothetical protein
VFGFLLVFAVGPFVAPLIGGTVTGSPFVFVAFTLAMGIAFYFQTKKMIFDLADEVLDDGDWLVVRKGRHEDRIALADIMNLNYSLFWEFIASDLIAEKTKRVRHPRQLSRTRPFWTAIWPFSQPPIVDELVERIDAKRRFAATR